MYGILSLMKNVKQKKKTQHNNHIHFLGDIDMSVKYKTTKDQKFRRLQTQEVTVVTSG